MKTLQEQRTEAVLNMQKRITELEKENTELKEINEGYCRNRDRLISMGFPNFKDCKEYAAKLTKAKELLKWFVWYFKEGSSNLVPYRHKVEEAEQFLKDCEVEKK